MSEENEAYGAGAIRRFHRLTGSKVWLAEHCRHWARSDIANSRVLTSGPLRIGSALHEVAELHPVDENPAEVHPGEFVDSAFQDIVSEGSVDMDRIAEKWHLRPSEIDVVRDMYDTWREWWPGYVGTRGPIRRELPLAWDTATWKARVLQVKGPRDYSQCVTTEIPCTIDLVIGPDGGPIEVIDYKTGFLPVSAVGHLQGATCALAIAHATNTFPVTFTIVRVRRETITTSSVVLDAAALDECAASLQFWVEDILGGLAEPQPGEHCDFCPAIAACPQTHAILDEVRVQHPALRRAWFGAITSNDHAARVRHHLPILKAVIEQMEEALVEFAEKNPSGIRMPDGSTHRRVSARRRTLNPEDPNLIALLEQKFGPERAQKLVTVKRVLNLGPVMKAAKALAPRGQKDDAAAEFMADIDALASGVTTTTYRRWSDEED
jgi:hypothetical protein